MGQAPLATSTFWVNRGRRRVSWKTSQSPEECSQYYRYCGLRQLCHGNAEIPHDAAVITLLETAIANNLTFNADEFVFKCQDCLFFGGNLTLHGYKMDPQKVQSITAMRASQNLQDLQSYLGLTISIVLAPKLADLTILDNGRVQNKRSFSDGFHFARMIGKLKLGICVSLQVLSEVVAQLFRALHRYRRDQGSNPGKPIFFRVFFATA